MIESAQKDIYETESDSSFEYYYDKLFDCVKRKKKQFRYTDENVLNAIEIRESKKKHSDYFFKLVDLKEKIEVYNYIFKSSQPKFLFPPKVKTPQRSQTPKKNNKNASSLDKKKQ